MSKTLTLDEFDFDEIADNLEENDINDDTPELRIGKEEINREEIKPIEENSILLTNNKNGKGTKIEIDPNFEMDERLGLIIDYLRIRGQNKELFLPKIDNSFSLREMRALIKIVERQQIIMRYSVGYKIYVLGFFLFLEYLAGKYKRFENLKGIFEMQLSILKFYDSTLSEIAVKAADTDSPPMSPWTRLSFIMIASTGLYWYLQKQAYNQNSEIVKAISKIFGNGGIGLGQDSKGINIAKIIGNLVKLADGNLIQSVLELVGDLRPNSTPNKTNNISESKIVAQPPPPRKKVRIKNQGNQLNENKNLS